MGSQSDWAVMRRAAETLEALGVGYDAGSSPPIDPDRLVAFAKGAKAAGFKVVIAGAAARASAGHGRGHDHASGVRRACPLEGAVGQDSLLSIVQMPAGVPVGTLAIGEPARSTRRSSPRPFWRSAMKRSRRGSRRGGQSGRPRSPSGLRRPQG